MQPRRGCVWAVTRGVLRDPTDKPRKEIGFRVGGWEGGWESWRGGGRVELVGRKEGWTGKMRLARGVPGGECIQCSTRRSSSSTSAP